MTGKRAQIVEGGAGAQLVKDAAKQVETTDARGRKIALRKPTVLHQYKLVELVGADRAANQVYMMMIMPIAFVVKIEDDDIYFPTKQSELEAIIQRLDEDGIEAVGMAVTENWGTPEAAEAVRTALKK